MTNLEGATKNPSIREVLDEYLETQKADETWLYEMNVQNYLDGADPDHEINVRMNVSEALFSAFSGFVLHHRYSIEFREDRHLIGKIDVCVGVLFDLQDKTLEKFDLTMDESYVTDEFLDAIPRNELYEHSWPMVAEVVSPIIQAMRWPEVSFPPDHSHRVDMHSWFYGPLDVPNRVIAF